MKKIPATLWIVLAILVIFVGIIVYVASNKPVTSYEKMTSRQMATLCLPMEGQVMHIHPHLTMMADKQTITLPADIGVNKLKDCMTSLHTHDATGIIHVESPVQKDFILGDFFSVWGMTFNKDQILDHKTDADHGLKMFVDGKETTDFENVVLKDHQDILIDYYDLKAGPDALPAPFDWKAVNL